MRTIGPRTSVSQSVGEDVNRTYGTTQPSVCVSFLSDDRTEKAETAHRPAGTPSAHEHQPAAARVRPSRRHGCRAPR